MSAIFGGSKSKQSSTSSGGANNQAYGTISSALAPLLGYAKEGLSGLSSLLGGDSSGLEAYKRAVGFNSAEQAGSTGLTNNAAASGLLRSGSTAKGLTKYASDISNQYANDYINKLLGLTGQGLQAGSVLSGAGNTSFSQGTSSGRSSSKPGIGAFLGAAL